ncbi:hypothetical protein RJ639_028243 [Escallonia herrerae]|uniref:RPA-interacting protein n=1 Tax=Escallonia herrerae TaxID=1293975 RepID=A0AA88XCN8_9ASTE|nr:hypothetical protein RJ639_028243 [Escallonia herrerae]
MADPRHQRRPFSKTHQSFNTYLKWKAKLRENCCKRVREDRSHLLWKMRLPPQANKDQSLNHKEFMKSTFQDIVTDELRKINDSSMNIYYGTATTGPRTDDELWEYDGLQAAYQGECEEILLEMQRIFYEDIKKEPTSREPEVCNQTLEDEEDEYLARAVYEHMQLKDEQVPKEVWCPICKQGELRETCTLIYCTLCGLELTRGNEVTLDLLKTRLAEAHTEHLERGCRLRPKFCVKTRFYLTAMYIECQGCSTFEVVI